MSSGYRFNTLPDDALYYIFSTCDVPSLGRLPRVCQRFRNVLAEEDIWIQRSKTVLGSNLYSKKIKQRSKPLLTPREKCRASVRWLQGHFDRLVLLQYNRQELCMPWLELEKEFLYLSIGNNVLRYSRERDGSLSSRNIQLITSRIKDVSKFALSEDKLIICGREGLICCWDKERRANIETFQAHDKEVTSADVLEDVIISGSLDNTVKIWKPKENEPVTLFKKLNLFTRVLSLAIHPDKRIFFCGTPGTGAIHPLQVFDINTCRKVTELGATFTNGAGILDLHIESNNTLLSCGYDTTVRLWDIRCPKNHVMQWMDPYDNAIYCVTSDDNVTIVSGAGNCGTIHIWDKRMTSCVNIIIERNRSPVYSVAFDACYIYSALDTFFVQRSVIPL